MNLNKNNMNEVAITVFLVQFAAYFAEAQITISTYPRPLHVTVGTTFTLSCNYEGHTFVSWEHPTLGVVTQNTGHVAVSNLVQVSIATLEVNHAATSEDQGRYTCTARASNGQMVTEFVQATLYDAVEVTTQNNLVFSSLEGSTATVSLPCSAINHDRIAWRRLGISTELTNATDPGRLVILPDRLVINNVRFSDNGSYECTASNTVGFRSILSILVVHVSASVTASPVSSTVSEGSNAQFEFIVTGNPLPTVEWYKGTINDTFRINLGPPQLTSELTSSITSVYRLMFSSVTSENTGTYICQAYNQFGVPASAQITLQLFGTFITTSEPTDTEYTTTGFEQTNPDTTENGTTAFKQTSPKITGYATTAFEETSPETKKYATTVFEETASGCCNYLSLPAVIMCYLFTLYF